MSPFQSFGLFASGGFTFVRTKSYPGPGRKVNAATGGKNSLVPGEISLWLQKQPRIFVEK